MSSLFISLAIGIAAIIGGFVIKDISSIKSTAPQAVVAISTSTPTSASIVLDDSNYKNAAVTIAGKTFNALVSDTDALRTLGLSGRTGLAANQVMLFVFDKPDYLDFWMKDMLFSIDMLWLDENYRVVSFEENAMPDSYPKIFFPVGLSKYVIELPAGTLANLGIKSGDSVIVGNSK